MNGQFYFTTLAGLALSVAGFAGLVTALRGGGRWSRNDLWRLRQIVGESITLVVLAVIPLPIYYAVAGDEPLTIRIASALLALWLGRALVGTWRERGDWRDNRWIRQALLLVGVQFAAQAANVALAWLPLLMAGLLALLFHPMQLFWRVIQDFQPPIDDE